MWQVLFTILASKAFCGRGFPIHNHIKSSIQCSFTLKTLEAQTRVAMVKILIVIQTLMKRGLSSVLWRTTAFKFALLNLLIIAIHML